MEPNKNDISDFATNNGVKGEDFSADQSPAEDGNPAVELEDNTENSKRADEVITLKSNLDEQKDKYLRLAAEFENYRRRSSKERLDLIQTAGKDVIIPLLQVLDDCDRAEKQMQETNDAGQIKEGIQLVFNKLRKTLQAQGLRAMESLNSDFDVEKHEAITEIPVEDKKLKGKVVDEVEKGYYLNDKLIRFAKVVVGK